MSHIFMSYCRHEQTLQALNECEWMDDLEQVSQAKIKDCYRLQKAIIELAKQFGCEISNKDEVLDNIKEQAIELSR